MKVLKSILGIALAIIVLLSFSACEKAATESCEQQDMNEILNCGGEKNVEVCCEAGLSCVYKFNGVEYPDTSSGLNDLAEALGCAKKKSSDYDNQKQMIIEYLISLKEQASAGLE